MEALETTALRSQDIPEVAFNTVQRPSQGSENQLVEYQRLHPSGLQTYLPLHSGVFGTREVAVGAAATHLL